MPRPLRIEYAGARYHVMSRGDLREAIFYDDADRQEFLRTLGQACLKTGWQVHAYCLMNNHFHLVIETPQPNLSLGMEWLLGTYTQRFNRRHRHWGHLFGGRYKAQLIDGRSPGYLRAACDYVHLNPVRARLIAAEQPLHLGRSGRWLLLRTFDHAEDFGDADVLDQLEVKFLGRVRRASCDEQLLQLVHEQDEVKRI